MSHLDKLRKQKVLCEFCGFETNKISISKHIKSCYLNPLNIKECVVCGNPVKEKSRTTCSYSCSNKHFRTGENNGNWKEHTYRTTCFLHHEKKCIVCGEQNVVEVHHHDGNRENNEPRNLVPLCPTHHQYVHSRHYYLIKDVIECYIKKFIGD